jgi:hypothetical protein
MSSLPPEGAERRGFDSAIAELHGAKPSKPCSLAQAPLETARRGA